MFVLNVYWSYNSVTPQQRLDFLANLVGKSAYFDGNETYGMKVDCYTQHPGYGSYSLVSAMIEVLFDEKGNYVQMKNTRQIASPVVKVETEEHIKELDSILERIVIVTHSPD